MTLPDRALIVPVRSLPSRGAWIEMISGSTRYDLEYVAPLAGSVDRNACIRPMRKKTK